MNTHQVTQPRRPRAVLAIKGAQAARARARFVAVVARQLHQIAPGTVRVHTVPTTHHGRATRAVVLYSAAGVLPTTAEQRAAAYGLLTRAFPEADWDRARTYDATSGVLVVDEPVAPAALGLDAVEGVDQ
ncbi:MULTISPECIES: hypothetical protein [Streptomyces]|uniref:hypothetical protein n=1 Tax=Streptomyces TaxID=1883 RepID=UPI0007211DE5|nr:hypothetical protein [Streptomyces sp. FR-008]ALM38202.1 hypothetical protein SFR_1587 [Streptomyces sp. FR-008]KAF0795848.1 hypothetical protein P405_00355 [Streptomyces sp. FR-008]